MEMPVDILKFRLGGIRDNGDIDFDHTAAALEIDEEMQDKFLFIPIEDLEAADITEDRGRLYAGSGPEHCNAGEDENPNWLYNHGMNALALWWKLKKDQEAAETLAAAEAEIERIKHQKLSQRPVPGVYMLNTGGEIHLTVVDAQRRIFFGKNRAEGTLDVTDIYDGLENKSHWVFTRIETGLSA